MKKVFLLILTIIMCIPFCACSEDAAPVTEATSEATSEALTAREQLSDLEEQLFDHIISITTDTFYEPSAIRLLEIGDYMQRSTHDSTDVLYGPDTVVVRLQGENRVGGTLNHYYMICLTTAKNTTEDEIYVDQARYASILDGEDWRLFRYEGTAGDYDQLYDSYEIKTTCKDIFDIGNINKAIAEYWEDLGF